MGSKFCPHSCRMPPKHTVIFELLSDSNGGGEICIWVNLSTVQWVYLYTFFSNFRGQNRGEICIHRRSKQGWNLYTKGQGKEDICLLYSSISRTFLGSKQMLLFTVGYSAMAITFNSEAILRLFLHTYTWLHKICMFFSWFLRLV